MGQSGDLMAREFKISRDEQDKFAVESHLKAHAAWERGFYKSHVVAVATPDGKLVDRDTDIRSDTSVEKLSKLRPVFYKDGTITAGNASPLTDGASALLLMRESKARELRLQPLGVIRGYAAAAVDIKKEPLLIGPAYAIRRALKKAGMSFKDWTSWSSTKHLLPKYSRPSVRSSPNNGQKINSVADQAIGEIDLSNVNVNGGSIPLGHPFGATGGRMILQTLHELRARKKNLGLISICAAGGLGP